MKHNKERSPGVSEKRELFEKSSSSLTFNITHDNRGVELENSQSVRSFAHPPEKFSSPSPSQRRAFSPKSASAVRKSSIGDVWPPKKPNEKDGKDEITNGDFHKSFSVAESSRHEAFPSPPMSVKVKAKMFAGQFTAPDLDLDPSPGKKRNGVGFRKELPSTDNPVSGGVRPPRKVSTDGEPSDRFGNSKVGHHNTTPGKSRFTSSGAGQYRLEAFVSPMPSKNKAKSWVSNKSSPQQGPSSEMGKSPLPKRTWVPTPAPPEQRFLPSAFRTPQTGRRSLETRYRYGDLPKIDAHENLSPSRVKTTHQWISNKDDENDHKFKGSPLGLPQISVGSMAAQWPQVANQSKSNFQKDRPKDLSPQVPVSTRRTAFELKGGTVDDTHEDISHQGRWKSMSHIDYNEYLDEKGEGDYVDFVEGDIVQGEENSGDNEEIPIDVEGTTNMEEEVLDVDDDPEFETKEEPEREVNGHDPIAGEEYAGKVEIKGVDDVESTTKTEEITGCTDVEGDNGISDALEDVVGDTNEPLQSEVQPGEGQVDGENVQDDNIDQISGGISMIDDDDDNDQSGLEIDIKGEGDEVPVTTEKTEETLPDGERNSFLQDRDELLLEDSGEYVESDLTTSSEEESYNPKRTGYRIRYDGPTTLPIDRYKPPPIPDFDERFASEHISRDTPSLPSRTVDKTPSAPRRALSGDSNEDGDDSTINSRDSCNRPDVYITPLAGITVEDGMWTVRRVWALDEADKNEKDHTVNNSQLFQKIRTLVGAPDSPPARDGAPKLPMRTWKVKKVTEAEDGTVNDDASEMSLQEDEMAEGIQTFVKDAAKEEVEIVAKIAEYKEKREEKRRRRRERKKNAKNNKEKTKDKNHNEPKSPHKKKKKKQKSPKEDVSKISGLDSSIRNRGGGDQTDWGYQSKSQLSESQLSKEKEHSRKGGRDKPVAYSPIRSKGTSQTPVAEIPVAYIETKKTKISAKPIITRRKKPELGRRSKTEEDKWWKGDMDGAFKDSSSDDSSSGGSSCSSQSASSGNNAKKT